jgi:membrane associated rhomboid family serine protease
LPKAQAIFAQNNKIMSEMADFGGINNLLVLATVVLSLIYMNDPLQKSKLCFNPYSIEDRKQFWRIWTCGFIHADYIHLAFNMLALYSFGRAVEATLGSTWYLILYILAFPFSNLGSFFKYRHSRYYNSLGASGAVSAVVFVSILYYPTAQISLYFFLQLPAWFFGAAYLIYSYYAAKQSQDNIDHFAHFFGSAFGIVFAVIYDPEILQRFVGQILRGTMM